MSEFVPLISLYANSQNKVNTADFSANGPFHQKLEELSRTIWAPAAGGLERDERHRQRAADDGHRERAHADDGIGLGIERQAGEDQDHVREPHQDGLHAAAEVPRHEADDHSDRDREERGRESDEERDAAPPQELAEDVPPAGVRPEDVRVPARVAGPAETVRVDVRVDPARLEGRGVRLVANA